MSAPDDDQANGQTPAKKTPKATTAKSEGQSKKDMLRSRAGGVKEKVTHKKEEIKDKAKPAGGYDPTPLPDVPSGYTVKFTIHKAWNLPAADLHDASADPYIEATLTVAVPKRHKEDPIMVHRTKTLHGTTAPEWEDEWIVANVPASGFKLKCRIYDEDYPDRDDRLGNVTVTAARVDENWKGLDRREFDVKKRMGSKRAYFFKAATSAVNKHASMTPHLQVSVKVLGRSDPPGAHVYTVGPTNWVQHFSPVIGRLTGIKVNKDERGDETATQRPGDKRPKKYELSLASL